MDYLVKNYLEVCSSEFSQYGFKRKKNAFVRVVNDVMQNFAFEKIMSGRECRVEFAIIPLCLRIEKEYISGGVYSHELKKFEPVHGTQRDPWEFDPKSEKSMNECITGIVAQIKKHLIPLFNKADNCKNAYKELCELDRKIYVKSEHARENDRKFFQSGVNMLDYNKYCMALKIGDYHMAQMHLKAIEQQNVDAYNSMSERGYLTEEDKTSRENRIAELRRELEIIAKNDESYIQRFIQENEAYSLNNLKGFT